MMMNKSLCIAITVMLLNGCVITHEWERQKEIEEEKQRVSQINKENEEKLKQYQACVVQYDTDISLELLKQRSISKIIGNDRRNSGFMVYTVPTGDGNNVDVSTTSDIVTIPLVSNKGGIASSKKFGARISADNTLIVAKFYTDLDKCLLLTKYPPSRGKMFLYPKEEL